MNGNNVLLLLLWFASFIFLVKNDTPIGLKGYTSHNNTRASTLYLGLGTGTYAEAFRHCNKLGMNLGGIESLTEWEYIVDILSQIQVVPTAGFVIWTSGNNFDKPNTTEFSWLASGNHVPTILFAEGQPNGQDCVVIASWDRPDHLGYNGFALNDWYCNYIGNGYLCESRNCID